MGLSLVLLLYLMGLGRLCYSELWQGAWLLVFKWGALGGVWRVGRAWPQQIPNPLPVPPSKGSAGPLPPPVTTTMRTTTSTAALPTTSTTTPLLSQTTTALTTTPAPTSKATKSQPTTRQSTSKKTTPAPTTAWTSLTKSTTVQPATSTIQSLTTKIAAPQQTATTPHSNSSTRVVIPTPPRRSSPAHPLTPVFHLSCSRTHVPCHDGTGCVAQEYLCDGEKDCADGSDEDGCAQLCNTPGRSHSSVPCAAGSPCARASGCFLLGQGPGKVCVLGSDACNVTYWSLLNLALGLKCCWKRIELISLLIVA